MASMQPSDKGQTLSRASLYAPLTAHLSNCDTSDIDATNGKLSLSSTTISSSPNATAASRGPPPAAIREQSLYAFLEKVSEEYHSSNSILFKTSNVVGFGGCGNNGGRALKRRQIESKLAQRALTLIGGGIGSSLVTSTSELVGGVSGQGTKSFSLKNRSRKGFCNRVHGSISKKKRKASMIDAMRASKEGDVKSIESCENVENTNITNKMSSVDGSFGNNQNEEITQILLCLNDMWNDYIQKLLQNIKIKREICSRISTAEMVGAYVRIGRCKAHNSYVGINGVIVDVTVNTWRISMASSLSRDRTCNTTSSKKEGGDLKDNWIGKTKWKILIVPKKGSMLAFRIPLDSKSLESDCPSLCIEVSGDGLVIS